MASRKSAPAPEVEVVDKPGMGIDEGIVIMTFLLLIGAMIFVYMANEKYVA